MYSSDRRKDWYLFYLPAASSHLLLCTHTHLQAIAVSRNWGFTNFTREEYKELRSQQRLVPDGCYVKVVTNHGTLEDWKKTMLILNK